MKDMTFRVVSKKCFVPWLRLIDMGLISPIPSTKESIRYFRKNHEISEIIKLRITRVVMGK